MANPTGKGGFQKGSSGNEGGLTPEEREARDWVRKQLAAVETRAAGMAAYRALLDDKNPLIVKDFMDRVVGKVKEHVEIGADDGLLELVREMLTRPDEERRRLASGG